MTDKHIPASKLLALPRYDFINEQWLCLDDVFGIIDEAPESATMTSDEDLPTEYDPADHDYSTPLKFMSEQDDEAVAYAEQDNVDMQSYDDLNFSYPVSTKPTENRTVPLYTRPANKTHTESDIDEAIGAVDWANTSWQQAAVEAKKLVMRFVGSQVTMEPKRLSKQDIKELWLKHTYAGFSDDPESWEVFANALMNKMTGGGR